MSIFKGFILGCLGAEGVDLDRQFVFVFLMVDVGKGVELRCEELMRERGEWHGEGELTGEGRGVVWLFVSVDRFMGWFLSITVSESELLSERSGEWDLLTYLQQWQ